MQPAGLGGRHGVVLAVGGGVEVRDEGGQLIVGFAEGLVGGVATLALVL